MIKELKYLFFLIVIFFFLFFSLRYYFSDQNNKNSYRSLSNVDKSIEKNKNKNITIKKKRYFNSFIITFSQEFQHPEYSFHF